MIRNHLIVILHKSIIVSISVKVYIHTDNTKSCIPSILLPAIIINDRNRIVYNLFCKCRNGFIYYHARDSIWSCDRCWNYGNNKLQWKIINFRVPANPSARCNSLGFNPPVNCPGGWWDQRDYQKKWSKLGFLASQNRFYLVKWTLELIVARRIFLDGWNRKQ